MEDRMADHDKAQSEGRKENAAQPKAPGASDVSPQAYPASRQDDSIERTGNPAPRQGAGDGSAPPSTNEGRIDPGGDPAEGKR
jgi:hypothetical protein